MNHIEDTVDNIGASVAAIERFTVAWNPMCTYGPMWLFAKNLAVASQNDPNDAIAISPIY